MWARVVEFMLGCWFLCGPFIFRDEARGDLFSGWDFLVGFGVIAFALMSFMERTRYAHLGTLFLATCIVIGPRILLTPEIPAAGQNFMMVGFLLLMFAMVPNQATLPSRAWRSVISPQETTP